jgi:hypothetical protein
MIAWIVGYVLFYVLVYAYLLMFQNQPMEDFEI